MKNVYISFASVFCLVKIQCGLFKKSTTKAECLNMIGEKYAFILCLKMDFSFESVALIQNGKVKQNTNSKRLILLICMS